MILWKFTVREVKSRKGRALLTLGSIIIGVAAVVAVKVATVTTSEANKEMYQSVAGRTALEVKAEGGGPFEASIVSTIQQIKGVKAVVPIYKQQTKLKFGETVMGTIVMGVDPQQDDALADYMLVEGVNFREKGGGMLDAGFARGLGIRVGDTIAFQTHSAAFTRVTIVGLVSPKGSAGLGQAGLMFLPLQNVQLLYKQRGSINEAGIMLDEGADEGKARTAIASCLPDGLRVEEPAARARIGREALQTVELGLIFSFWLTLVLSLFMILNTFLMNVGERRRQLSILRAVGTTKKQITRMLLLEGLMMGTLGTVIGTALGLGGAIVISGAMGRFYGTGLPALRITPEPFVWATIIGPGMSLLAMLIPAWIAGKVSPLEGMRPAISEPTKPVSPWFAICGLTLFVITASVLVASVMGYLPIEATTYAGVAMNFSFVLLIPPILNGFSRMIALLLSPILGTECRLAQRQVVRRRTRTALTVGVLCLAVSSGVSIGTTIINNIDDVRTWLGKTFTGDFFVRSTYADMSTNMSTPMPEDLRETLQAIPGVTNIETLFTMKDVHINDESVFVVLREFNDSSRLPLLLKQGDPQDVRHRLKQGEVVLGSVLAKKLAVNVGDSITMPTRQGPQKLRIAGVVTEYMAGGLIVQMDRAVGKRLFNVDGVHLFMVSAEPAAMAAVESQLRTIANEHGYMLQSLADVRGRLDGMLNGVIGSLWAILALGFVVAGFGIANTLTMNVLEQTRDLALLRVVAMTRKQVRKTILSQATIIAFVGLVLGIAGGVLGSYVTSLCTLAVLGNQIDFTFHPILIVAVFVTALAIVLIAALIPANRAAKLNLLIALQYE